MKSTEKTTKNNQSVVKLLRIIEAMADYGKPIRLKDLAGLAGMPESTVLRLLISLLENGYAVQDGETQKYTLTYKLVRIGSQVQAGFSIVETVRPYLEELAQRCQESACLAIEQDGGVMYIDTVDGPNNMLQTLQKIGKTAPLYCTGVGKNLLLNYTVQQVRSMYSQREFTSFTPHTVTSVDELLSELERVREQGVAYDNEECELGARCIAAPLYDYTKKVVASISVSGPTLRMTPEKMEAIKAILLRVSAELSALLAYRQ